MSQSLLDWVLASDNPGKLREIDSLLAQSGIRVKPQHAFGISALPESGLSFVENAIIKARHASAMSRLPAIADDSGLCVDALGGKPGLYSSRFAGRDASDEQNIDRLLSMLNGVPHAKRSAHFYCVMVALKSAEDPAPVIAVGRWFGRIAAVPSGHGGFGYDPVFAVGHGEETAAQLTPEQKNAQSHRGQALDLLRQCLIEERAQSSGNGER